MLKIQPDNHRFRLNITTHKKYILRPSKNGFVVQNSLFHIFCKIAFYVIFVIEYELRDQGGHSETSKNGRIILCASIF